MGKKFLTSKSFFAALVLVVVAALAPLISSATNQADLNSPSSVIFDGSNIWVANAGSDSVLKVQGTTGAVLGAFAVGDAPESTRL